MEDLHRQQDPPYSKGLLIVEIRECFLKVSWTNSLLFADIMEPVFTLMGKQDMIYCNPNFSRFASKRISDKYKLFSENMAEKFPGYMLN